MTYQSSDLTHVVASRRPSATALGAYNALAIFAGAFLFLATISGRSLGQQINYGSHVGTHFTFIDVTEDSGTGDPLPLFGAPIFTGDSMDFNPIGFDAASNAGGSDITASKLVLMIEAHVGSSIDSVLFSESGDTTLAGNVPSGSMGTSSAVFARGTLEIQEVDSAGVTPILAPISLTFTPSGGTYFLGVDGGGLPMFHTPWTGSATVDVVGILLANGVPFTNGATKISIELENSLSAMSEPGTTAFVGKTDFGAIVNGIGVRNNDTPEPASVALAGLGLLALGAGRRRGVRHGGGRRSSQ